MKVVIFVAYVGISSGNSSVDIIKLKEGDVWEVDKYTMQFEDSQDLRKHNKKAMEEFKRKFNDNRVTLFYRCNFWLDNTNIYIK